MKCSELETKNAELQEAHVVLADKLEAEKKAAEEQKRHVLI